MSIVSEILSNATGDKKEEKVYISSKGNYYELNETGTDISRVEGEPPACSKVLDAVAIHRANNCFCALLHDGDMYKLSIWRGNGSIPVFQESVRKQPDDVSSEELELCGVCENEKFLGIGTFIMTDTCLYGSSAYYEWDGSRFTRICGQLDDWSAGESDREYMITEDGERLVEKIVSNGDRIPW